MPTASKLLQGSKGHDPTCSDGPRVKSKPLIYYFRSDFFLLTLFALAVMITSEIKMCTHTYTHTVPFSVEWGKF